MLIGKLLNTQHKIEISGIGYGDHAQRGDLYFCLHSGERLLTDMAFAREREVAAIVTEKVVKGIGVPQFAVKNARKQFAESSAAFYDNPSRQLTMIGVTGTNGKTTTTHIIKSIMEAAGHKTGLIGTNGVVIGHDEQPATLTTPDPPELHRALREMVDSGVDTVVMEVSAHALALDKLEGIVFAVSAFTNLTQDHLDFFGSMDAYKKAKLKLFEPKQTLTAVVNVDDKVGMEILRSARVPMVSYGCDNPSDVFGIEYHASDKGCEFVANIMDDIMELHYCAPGRFNMSNVLCAAAVTKILGVSSDATHRGVAKVGKVDGRFEILRAHDKRVVIDYAHTPDGLGKLLRAVREITKGRVIAVFGCGGDRDRTKRAVMGEIASELSDFAVVTSDNPRSEPPLGIIKQIESGFKTANYMLIEDRRDGIKYALDLCGKDDTVVIAGKGHECTQERAGKKERFSDKETVKELLK